MRNGTLTNAMMGLLLCGAAPLALGLGLSGCGEEPAQDEVSATTSGLGLSFLPQGLTCGGAYKNGSSKIVDGVCNGAKTLSSSGSNLYSVKSDGDAGLGSGSGFYHQYFTKFATPYDTTNLILPQGTVCGFKHTAHGDTETCIGSDPERGNCPAGWTWRMGQDANAPNGSNFVWCEYNDSHNNCPGGSCLSSMPSGMMCGMTDTTFPNGMCQGMATGTGIRNIMCPIGYAWSYATAPNAPGTGYYDAGRPIGQGLGFCTKI